MNLESMRVVSLRRVLGLGAAIVAFGVGASPVSGQPSSPPAETPGVVVAAPVATQMLHGTITAEHDRVPLAGASVSIAATGALVFTDAKGEYSLAVVPGTHTIRVEMPGYAPVEHTVVVGAESAVLDVALIDDARGEVITIVGARTPRSRLETPVPVDVVTSDVITESSHTELNQILNTVAPSFNASRLSIADGTDHIDPADLRGLGPEHVLVLINGKRLHQSSLINVYNGGTVGVDLNAIPTNAIARIEVLRDGAASQYGSDAIAGVINIVLKDTVDSTQLYSMTGETASNDGTQFRLGANTGFKLGERGFVNVTGELFTRGRTNRSRPWSGDIFPGIEGAAATDAELARRNLTREAFTMDVGQSGAYVGTGFLNAGYKLDRTFELYAQGGYTFRAGNASGYFRLPNDGNEHRIDPRIYPDGFLPEINPQMHAWNGTVGLRGKRGLWEGDLSLTSGGDRFHFFVDHSLNASLGLASPTHFDAGALNFYQSSVNFDGVRRIDQPVLAAISVVAGAELRRETYAIDAGQPESYELGPELDTAGQPKAPGSQVFPGFRPSDASSNNRVSEAAYAGIESQPTARTNLDLGARFEHYSDFGNTLTGKIAARAALVKSGDSELAVRGSASTGFRAPGLQQLWYSTIASQFVTSPDGPPMPTSILISPNRSAVTEAFGVPHLKEETSVNLSAGATAHVLSNLSLSADYYHVKINDRVVLSGKFGTDDMILGSSVADIVSPFPGVAAVQFFINAVDTSTDGVDIVADYSQRLTRGSLKLTAAANVTATTVDRVNVPAGMLQRFGGIDGGAAQVKQIFLSRYGRNRFEDVLPRQKGTLGVRWDYSGWSTGVRGNAFGRTEYRSDSGAALDESYAPRVTFDVDVGLRIAGLWWSIGANNVLNTFPAENKREGNRNSDSFLYSPADVSAGAPYGTDGAFYYARVEYRF